MATSKATFAAGCFWGIEATFRKVEGVVDAQVGYTGGATTNPSYESVCSGATGHAEAVELEFDPATVTYEALLDAFWMCHDPTTANRQGPDVGSQYRSAIFFQTPEQQSAARDSQARAQQRFKNPIVTEIAATSVFYRAEEYHQQYLAKCGRDSCGSA